MNTAPVLQPLNRGNCAEKVLDYNTNLFWVSSPRGHLQCVSRTGYLFHTVNSLYIHAYKQTPPSAQACTYRYIHVPVCAHTHTNPSIHPSFSLLNLPDLWLSSFFILILKQSLSIFFWQNSGIQKKIQSVARSRSAYRTRASLALSLRASGPDRVLKDLQLDMWGPELRLWSLLAQ